MTPMCVSLVTVREFEKR